ncbi:MAG TPA: prepilin-type N-terminal cleavage/methylation domain-containing protein [Haliangiales bacterium]|nr:prepilin-type N-terminal cleavage/methylation domain-containing protein [Haliangiales bacterium]
MRVPVRGHDQRSAFTLMEVMVALAVSSLILGGVMTFLDMASKSLSGTASQTVVNQRAGNSSESIFRRVRFATSVSNSNDASGNTLRLGFDDDSSIDRNNDGKSYNDQDHYEVFQFQNGDGSDDTIADNSLIYRPREDQTNFIVLIPSGVQKLPGRKIFTVTNNCAVYVNFAVADAFARDGYQTCDIQSAFVSRNRPLTTNTFTILP